MENNNFFKEVVQKYNRRELMKKTFFLFISILLLIGCNESNKATSKGGLIKDLSKCGGFDDRKTRNVKINFKNDTSYISYNYKDNILFLTHYNAKFNCCPKSISAESTIDNNNIIIKETENTSSQSCDCMCLYDLEVKVDNIISNIYEISFDEAYGNDEINFTVDLDNNTSGTLSYERQYYPYGISQ